MHRVAMALKTDYESDNEIINVEDDDGPKTNTFTRFFIEDILSSSFGRIEEKSDSESTSSTSSITSSRKTENQKPAENMVWPAWVYCTRYSDRPSSGPRCRRSKKKKDKETIEATIPAPSAEKRPRTAFTSEQLQRLKEEFEQSRYLTEQRRANLAQQLGLNEAQIKIWFQNKRAKLKKSTGSRNPLALHLMAQGLYNHQTLPAKEAGSAEN